jgi:hypothetical protein
MPESIVPVTMFFPGNLPVFRSCIKVGVTEVFLKNSECVTRVIQLHCVHAKGISKTMRAHPSYPASIWID